MATRRVVLRHLVAGGLMIFFGLVNLAPAVAQESGLSSQPAPSPTPQPTPIAASDIPTRAADAANVAREAVAKSVPDAGLNEIRKSFPLEQDRIKELREETRERLAMPGPASMFKEGEKTWERTRARLDRWLAELSTRSSALDATLEDLQARKKLWKLTRDQESGAVLPEALLKQISEVVKNLSEAEEGVRSARNSILDLQASIAQEKSGVDEMLAKQQAEISLRTKGVFGIDSPPLWKAFSADHNRKDLQKQFTSVRREHWRSLKPYLAEQGGRLVIWALMWPALILLLVFMRGKAELWAQQDKSLQTAAAALSRPASLALVMTALLNIFLQPQAPGAWTDAVGLLLMLAILRVLPPLLPKTMGLAPYLLVLLFVLRRVVDLAPEGYVIYRLALLLLPIGGVVVCAWLIRTLRANPESLSKKAHTAVLKSGQAALVLFGIGAVANIIGSVGFSALVLVGTAHAMLAAVMMAVLNVALQSMVRVGLLTAWARRVGIAPEHSEVVRATLFRLIRLFALIAWVIVTLRGFLMLDPLLAAIRRALDWSVTIGSFSIDPGDYLIFACTIWLSFKIASLVQFVLKVDVLPRVDLPRGVPQTISRLTRYVVIAVGALIASAAAGFDISKVTIIVGALGVGVGFGLQNIVNNFVSGLVLLFERPIRVGDTLDIDGTGGVVEKIGMRASVVSTWDGAEVVVPNADLIAEKVTNWTLTQDRRRMTIPVGVAYGTDPEEAARLIVAAANEHEDVDDQPEPSCLFVGFGDSALEFQLRAWAAGSRYMRVSSDLRFTIVKKLNEALIEIPFPQCDLHLRSADPVAASSAGLQKQEDVSKNEQ